MKSARNSRMYIFPSTRKRVDVLVKKMNQLKAERELSLPASRPQPAWTKAEVVEHAVEQLYANIFPHEGDRP